MGCWVKARKRGGPSSRYVRCLRCAGSERGSGSFRANARRAPRHLLPQKTAITRQRARRTRRRARADPRDPCEASAREHRPGGRSPGGGDRRRMYGLTDSSENSLGSVSAADRIPAIAILRANGSFGSIPVVGTAGRIDRPVSARKRPHPFDGHRRRQRTDRPLNSCVSQWSSTLLLAPVSTIFGPAHRYARESARWVQHQ